MNGWLAKQIDVVFGHVLSSLVYRPGERATTDLAAMEIYQREEFVATPSRFFDCPATPPAVTFGEVHATRAYICEPFTFPSLYRPLSKAFAPRYAIYPEAHTVHGRRYRPFTGRSRATLLMLHGWTGGDYVWEERTLIPWLCRDCGYTLVALTHPYHGVRKPASARFSGEFFISADLVRTVEASRQAVIDARAALTWLLEETGGPVGVVGISLGALMTYLLLCADERPAFALPMLGHGDLFNGPGEASLTKNVRRDFLAQGLAPEILRPLTRPLTARKLQPRVAPERILPINGLYDAIITADKARRLFEAWEIPEVVWLNSGHFGIAYTRQFRRPFRAFVELWR
jgi:pimeloyl-ACP methyl ester carboxylesterase